MLPSLGGYSHIRTHTHTHTDDPSDAGRCSQHTNAITVGNTNNKIRKDGKKWQDLSRAVPGVFLYFLYFLSFHAS